jgi:hypothetical protein
MILGIRLLNQELRDQDPSISQQGVTIDPRKDSSNRDQGESFNPGPGVHPPGNISTVAEADHPEEKAILEERATLAEPIIEVQAIVTMKTHNCKIGREDHLDNTSRMIPIYDSVVDKGEAAEE